MIDPPWHGGTYDLKEVEGGVEFSLITNECSVGTKDREEHGFRAGKVYVEHSSRLFEKGQASFGWADDVGGLGAVLSP